jgi:hypothetical protein
VSIFKNFCLYLHPKPDAAFFFAPGAKPTQTMSGKITAQDSRIPLPGVNVVVVGADVFLGGSTSERGEFRIENIPVRRTTGGASANSEKVFRYLC